MNCIPSFSCYWRCRYIPQFHSLFQFYFRIILLVQLTMVYKPVNIKSQWRPQFQGLQAFQGDRQPAQFQFWLRSDYSPKVTNGRKSQIIWNLVDNNSYRRIHRLCGLADMLTDTTNICRQVCLFSNDRTSNLRWRMLNIVFRNEEITNRFAQLDRDGNGVLSPEEVVIVIKEMMGYNDQMAVSLMQIFDTNQDGSLDKTEFMQLWANMFGPR